MKFNKLLKSGIGSGETTASLYLRFGELKKQLKIMSQAMNQETDGVLLVSELSNSALCMLRPDDSFRRAQHWIAQTMMSPICRTPGSCGCGASGAGSRCRPAANWQLRQPRRTGE
jgi:hypothetical protein